jgi:uncharacterized protein (UPF0261 family)
VIGSTKTVLLIGTVDTKSDELSFLNQKLLSLGAQVVLMDVGVMTSATFIAQISNAEVALAASSTIELVRASDDENSAMQIMAQGSATIALRLYTEGKIQGVLALGGSMGTDLALEVASALPLGIPKVIISTIAYSHLIPPERVTPDLMMVLWAGGLYGLNELCRSALAQGAGCVVGAMQAAQIPQYAQPLVGMTSLGKSCLTYMVQLKPALESMGFNVAIFHSTGMGGRAFETLASQGKFVLVLDLCQQELANYIGGSCVNSGDRRLRGAGACATPQIVAPGAADMIDFPAWQAQPTSLQGRAAHVHNRLIASATSDSILRAQIARQIVQRTAQSAGYSHLIIPQFGIQAWDKPGQPLHDANGLAAMNLTLQEQAMTYNHSKFSFELLPAHINDSAFCSAVLTKIKNWQKLGIVPAALAN